MLVTPNSAVDLFKDVEISDGIQLCFTSRAKQNAYFQARKIGSVSNATYIRKTGRLRLEFSTATVSKCNYIGFRNAAYENITIFARVIDYEFVNEVTTDILYSIDWFQTFYDSVAYHQCLVERQHPSVDDWAKLEENPWRKDVYIATVPESGLATGAGMEEPRFKTYATPEQVAGDTAVACVKVAPLDSDSVKDGFENIGGKADYFIDSTRILNSFPFAGYVAGYSINNGKITKTAEFEELLDYLAVNNATHCVISTFVTSSSVLLGWERGSILRGRNCSFTFFAPENKKLLRAPFSYGSIDTLSNRKDLLIENFVDESVKVSHSNASSGQKYYSVTVRIDEYGLYDTAPKISLIPYGYGETVPKDHNNPSSGVERLDITDLPQIPYSTDAFLAYVGAQMSANAQTMTQFDVATNLAALSTTGVENTTLMDNVKAIGPALKTLLGDASAASEITKAKTDRYKMLGDIAYSQGGEVRGDYVDKVFGPAKRGFAGSEYHPGSGDTLPFYLKRGNEGNFWYYVQHSLNLQIQSSYDWYLTQYGWAYNRVDIPYVCELLVGAGKGPHFHQYKDGPAITYVKTAGMSVTGKNKNVTDYISEIFNQGCTFYKI